MLSADEQYLYRLGGLLTQWRCASRQYERPTEEFTKLWWDEQAMEHVEPFLIENFMECKQALIGREDTFERGLIHNDFHTNNTIFTDEQKIFVIDLVDAVPSLFIADLAVSIFHLLVNQNGKSRARTFLQGYQQLVPLSLQEIEHLDTFVRLKLTLSIIYDPGHSDDPNDPFIQSCFDLLRELKADATLVKSLV